MPSFIFYLHVFLSLLITTMHDFNLFFFFFGLNPFFGVIVIKLSIYLDFVNFNYNEALDILSFIFRESIHKHKLAVTIEHKSIKCLHIYWLGDLKNKNTSSHYLIGYQEFIRIFPPANKNPANLPDCAFKCCATEDRMPAAERSKNCN